MDPTVRRVVARWKGADNAPGARQHAQQLTTPINPPKGISKPIVRNQGKTDTSYSNETSSPDRRDVRPEDVFNLTPDVGGVLNFAETGKDLSNAIDRQIPKDKGYDAVSNLSQYLISTKGGGGAEPQGKSK